MHTVAGLVGILLVYNFISFLVKQLLPEPMSDTFTGESFFFSPGNCVIMDSEN